MALSQDKFGRYNPQKPMENRLTDMGPRHFWQYFPPIIQKNYGKWKHH
jgi:sulfite reductase beta subunit